jgi:two-component sensor histidine kinase
VDKSGKMIGALAMVTDITERKRAEEHQALLLQELDHRVKNTLATVIAMSDMTMAGARTTEEFANAFNGRIQAMARTHEALARARWHSVSLEQLVALVLAPLRTEDRSRFSVDGEPVPIPPYAITPLALTLNELGTNALKHGALSNERGTVRLEWLRDPDDRLSLTWREHGGPRISAAPSGGTGLQLIRGLVEYELRGRLELDFAPDGLACRVTVSIPVAD